MGFLYIGPWLLGFAIFELYPFISSLLYSFTDLNMFKSPNFVGLQNYIEMFTRDKLFLQSLKVTFIYAVIAVPLKLAFALLIAILLNRKLKGINFFRTIYYLPSIMGGSAAVALLWRYLFSREGLVNQMTGKLSIAPIDWLGSPDIALYTISALTVWQFGSSMVLFLAALKQVPGELYEAGRIDGASRSRMFVSITFPLITPIIFFNLIMQMVNAFQEFTAAMVITSGGPLNSTYLYGLLIYENGFKYFKMGYASAQSWVLFVIIMIFTLVIFKSSSKWVYYEDGGK
ncbi:ABC transporter permease subunit [Paenibacillus sepulcri]|uniref:ABC transporter permease subunit n=2 Tax=Paenibacillus sepulcri TaxID=359917 RepID=A0ABS7C0K0_9BACL|nr:ABC transporter permease subunit [Paenibacillus sepulcri]